MFLEKLLYLCKEVFLRILSESFGFNALVPDANDIGSDFIWAPLKLELEWKGTINAHNFNHSSSYGY